MMLMPRKMTDYISDQLMNRMFKDRKVRTAITQQSHIMFFAFYFSHYMTFQTAPFQKELFALTEDTSIRNLFVVAFRGSGKSTIFTMSYPVWSILGEQQKKFVLIICQTRTQAKQHMINLKSELETNLLLRNDLGPFHEERDEWGISSLVFSRYQARITAASTEQSIRGLRHNQHRPDLIICDDIEDIASTKTYESRQKTYNWLKGDVIPAGDRKTRLIIVGNLLHDDSLLMHLHYDLLENKIDGVFKRYPLIDENENIAWLGKYPDKAAIKEEEKKLGNVYAWKREYLLEIIRDEDQIVDPGWFRYYETLPVGEEVRMLLIGVDLAISQKDTADYTAIICGLITGYSGSYKVYILPNPINKRMTFPETIRLIQQIYDANVGLYYNVKILVEDVGYQRSVIQQLEHEGYSVEGIRVTSDKRSRLISSSSYIQSGKILLPKKGAEDILRQITGFGIERYDDLVDAFTIVAQKAITENRPQPDVIILGHDDDY